MKRALLLNVAVCIRFSNDLLSIGLSMSAYISTNHHLRRILESSMLKEIVKNFLCSGFGSVLKQRLLEQNGAKMKLSSKLLDTARPCQAIDNRHSHQHSQLLAQTRKIQDWHDRATPSTTVHNPSQSLISSFPRWQHSSSDTSSIRTTVPSFSMVMPPRGSLSGDLFGNGSKQDRQTKKRL